MTTDKPANFIVAVRMGLRDMRADPDTAEEEAKMFGFDTRGSAQAFVDDCRKQGYEAIIGSPTGTPDRAWMLHDEPKHLTMDGLVEARAECLARARLTPNSDTKIFYASRARELTREIESR